MIRDTVPDDKHGVGNWATSDIQAVFQHAECVEAFIAMYMLFVTCGLNQGHWSDSRPRFRTLRIHVL